jgi:hypothetical protein
MSIEDHVPGPLKHPYRRLRSLLKNRMLGSSNAEVFDSVYRRGLWGQTVGRDVCSGPGYDPAAAPYVTFVRNFIAERGIRNLVEIGCGDFEIGQRYADAVQSYVGVDVSSYVIERNRRTFSRGGISFEQADASERDRPAADLCIIRHVLQHLDNATIGKILDRVKVHKFVLVTEHLPEPSRLLAPNLDKRPGPDTRLTFNSGVYLEHPPFNRKGETMLNLPVSEPQAGPGEIMRTTLLVNA